MAKRMNKNQVEELQKTANVMYGEDSNITLPTAAMEAFGLTSLDDVDRITNEYEDVADPSLNPEEKYIEDEEKEDLKRIFISVMLGEESKNDSLIRAALEKRNETNFCKRAMGFILRQGLIDEKKRSYAEVGELLGVNPETVRTYDQAIQNRLFDIFAFGLKERDLIRAKKMSLPKSYTEIANMYINDELVRISESDLTEEQKQEQKENLRQYREAMEEQKKQIEEYEKMIKEMEAEGIEFDENITETKNVLIIYYHFYQ